MSPPVPTRHTKRRPGVSAVRYPRARGVELCALSNRQWKVRDTKPSAEGTQRILGIVERADDGYYDLLKVAAGGGIDSMTFTSLDAVVQHFDRA